MIQVVVFMLAGISCWLLIVYKMSRMPPLYKSYAHLPLSSSCHSPLRLSMSSMSRTPRNAMLFPFSRSILHELFTR